MKAKKIVRRLFLLLTCLLPIAGGALLIFSYIHGFQKKTESAKPIKHVIIENLRSSITNAEQKNHVHSSLNRSHRFDCMSIDEQAGGTYRQRKRTDSVSLGFAVSPHSRFMRSDRTKKKC